MLIANQIKKYINDNLSPYDTLKLDILDEGNNSICLQQLPSDPKVTRLMYGASEGEFDFRILAKHKEKMIALEQLQKICNHFNYNRKIVLTDKITISCDTTASPTIFEYSEKEYFIYQAQFKIKYTEGGWF